MEEMAEQGDVLSREVAIAAKLEENGIALRAKSRAVAALDRLVGSLFDMPAAFFEGVSSKRRLRDEITERLKSAQARLAEQQVKQMPELGTILINDVLEDRARKQANAAGIAVEAIETMKALPPPEAAAAGTSAQDHDEEIDEDWMNQFVRYAEDASSERLQQVWGRVLAGEIRKPGSFSRHTLRFIAELDKETAENCELLARHVVGKWLLKSDRWNEGKLFLVSVDLQRLGIIEGVGIGGPQQNFTVDVNGNAAIAGKAWGLLVRGTPGTKLSFPVFMLTRMGQEVMSLLNVADEAASLREIEGKIEKSGLQLIFLGRVTQLPGDQVIFTQPMDTIWVNPEAQPAPAQLG
jgi:hypothetical protein